MDWPGVAAGLTGGLILGVLIVAALIRRRERVRITWLFQVEVDKGNEEGPREPPASP